MITIEQILGFALRESQVLNRLGGALRNDLVTPNPYYRRVVEFGDDFQQERGKLPVQGDYLLWLSALPNAQRDGTSEALGRLQDQTFSEFDPEFFAEQVLETLREVAVNTALARMNENPRSISLEKFRALNERIESIGFESQGNSPQVRCFEDILLETILWIWRLWIPRGTISEALGEPGVGKSTLLCAIGAAVSRGQALLGELQLARKPKNVLFVSAEDSPSRTIRPRLEAAGADLSRCHILDGIEDEHGDLLPLNLRARGHRQHLAEVLERVGASLVVIDPLAAYLGATDSHRDSDVRGIISPLASIAELSGAAILFIRHLNKNLSARTALHRAGGSIGFSAAVRSSFLVGQVEEGSPERAIVSLKHNLSECPDPVGFSLENGEFRWTSELPNVTAAHLLQSEATAEERTLKEEAADWLSKVLRYEKLTVKELQIRAKADLDCSWKTIKGAKEKAGVDQSYDGRKREWSWFLKDQGGERDPGVGSLATKGDIGPLAKIVGNKGDSPPSPEQGAPSLLEGLLLPEKGSEMVEEGS